MKILVKLVFIITVLLLVISCSSKTEVTRGFYSWQSDYYLDEEENQKLFQSLEGERLYLKMFEVTYSNEQGAIPVAKTNMELLNKYMSKGELVPCVFIENDVLKKLSKTKLEELADNIVFLVDKYVYEDNLFETNAKNRSYKELQIDCDWSTKTKDDYFELLKLIKEKSQKTISCTMRLYPYKYRDKMGTPPVDRIMLLCYNLLNPMKNTDKNTILEIDELKKYIDFDMSYPVPIDIALPVYSSGYRFDQQRFDGVFHAVPEGFEQMAKPTQTHLHYIVPKDTSLNHTYFHKGEKIKVERISETDLIKAAELLSEHINQREMNVVLYHLDHEELNQYNHEILDSVFTVFN